MRCPSEDNKTYANFLECIWDYLDLLTGFPNIGNKFICWFCTVMKPALMMRLDFMCSRVHVITYLKDSLLHCMMALPKNKKKTNIILSVSLQQWQKYVRTHKGLPAEVMTLICFLISVTMLTTLTTHSRNSSGTQKNESNNQQERWLLQESWCTL